VAGVDSTTEYIGLGGNFLVTARELVDHLRGLHQSQLVVLDLHSNQLSVDGLIALANLLVVNVETRLQFPALKWLVVSGNSWGLETGRWESLMKSLIKTEPEQAKKIVFVEPRIIYSRNWTVSLDLDPAMPIVEQLEDSFIAFYRTAYNGYGLGGGKTLFTRLFGDYVDSLWDDYGDKFLGIQLRLPLQLPEYARMFEFAKVQRILTYSFCLDLAFRFLTGIAFPLNEHEASFWANIARSAGIYAAEELCNSLGVPVPTDGGFMTQIATQMPRLNIGHDSAYSSKTPSRDINDDSEWVLRLSDYLDSCFDMKLLDRNEITNIEDAAIVRPNEVKAAFLLAKKRTDREQSAPVKSLFTLFF